MIKVRIDTSLDTILSQNHLELESCLARTFTSDIYLCKTLEERSVLKYFSAIGRKDERNSALALKAMPSKYRIEIFEFDESYIWMEFQSGGTLKDSILNEELSDSETTEISCQILSSIHSCTISLPVELPSLESRFQSLRANPPQLPPLEELFSIAQTKTRQLLNSAEASVLLHGDFHHDNLMFSECNEWKVIDAKGLIGPAAYDYANLFLNPTGCSSLIIPEDRILQMATIIERETIHSANLILEFAFVHACLSIRWSISDKQNYSETIEFLRILTKILGMSPGLVPVNTPDLP